MPPHIVYILCFGCVLGPMPLPALQYLIFLHSCWNKTVIMIPYYLYSIACSVVSLPFFRVPNLPGELLWDSRKFTELCGAVVSYKQPLLSESWLFGSTTALLLKKVLRALRKQLEFFPKEPISRNSQLEACNCLTNIGITLLINSKISLSYLRCR